MAGNRRFCMGRMGRYGHVSHPRTRSSTGASLALAIPGVGTGPSIRSRDLAEARERYSALMMEVSRLHAFNADLESALATLSEAAAKA